MPNDIVHFAIHADDCERAKTFYETVFGWGFQPWGPPDFWLIQTSPRGIKGALQKRRGTAGGTGSASMGGYECTVSVDDVRVIAAAIEKAGGKVVMPPFLIERVGTLIQFVDTEGNAACAMQYEPGVMS